MLAAGHSHAARMRALLEAAQQAMQRTGWTSVAGEISLELVVRGPGRPPSDATNYLGGVSDVLQNKTVGRSLDLTHLSELGAVALYTDDRQIRQIHYTEEPADQASYSIRIRQLDPAAPAAAALAAPVATVEETATERRRRVVAALAAKGRSLASRCSTNTRFKAAGSTSCGSCRHWRRCLARQPRHRSSASRWSRLGGPASISRATT